MIPPAELARRWNLSPETILHVGAHEAEELEAYERLGWGEQRTLWVEALEDLAERLATRLADRPHHRVLNVVAWDKEENLIFHRTNNGQSSSALPLADHLKQYPSIVEIATIPTQGQRLDQVLDGDAILESGIDFLNLDIQGAELRCLEGMGDTIDMTGAIYSEVNISELYAECATLTDIRLFLKNRGFVLVQIRMTNAGWGDALWIKRTQTTMWQRFVRQFAVRWIIAFAYVRLFRKRFLRFIVSGVRAGLRATFN